MGKESSSSSRRRFVLTARGGSSLGRAFLHHIFSLAYGSDQQYNHGRFGFMGRFLPWLGLINLPAVQQVHRNINCWTNDQAMMWKQSTFESCTTVAVVVSLTCFRPFSNTVVAALTGLREPFSPASTSAGSHYLTSTTARGPPPPFSPSA